MSESYYSCGVSIYMYKHSDFIINVNSKHKDIAVFTLNNLIIDLLRDISEQYDMDFEELKARYLKGGNYER